MADKVEKEKAETRARQDGAEDAAKDFYSSLSSLGLSPSALSGDKPTPTLSASHHQTSLPPHARQRLNSDVFATV